VHQANFVCPGGIYRLGRQQKLLREGSPNHLNQFTRQLEGYHQSQARQRHPEACHIRRYAQVTMQGHLAAPSKCVAVHHGDSGMTQRLELVKEFDHTCACHPFGILLLAHLAQVTSSTKHLPSATYNDHTDVAVLLQIVEMGS
jgi:hypothetical protein